jgi:hypothetical protein
MIRTELPPAKGPADGFTMAEKAATWGSWKMLDTGWVQITNQRQCRIFGKSLFKMREAGINRVL